LTWFHRLVRENFPSLESQSGALAIGNLDQGVLWHVVSDYRWVNSTLLQCLRYDDCSDSLLFWD